MVSTCDTCKFWWLEEKETDWNITYRTCRCPKNGSESKVFDTNDTGVITEPQTFSESGMMFHGSYECPNRDWVKTLPNPPEDGSFAAAHDYYSAYWTTGPKFGCIHHQPK